MTNIVKGEDRKKQLNNPLQEGKKGEKGRVHKDSGQGIEGKGQDKKLNS